MHIMVAKLCVPLTLTVFYLLLSRSNCKTTQSWGLDIYHQTPVLFNRINVILPKRIENLGRKRYPLWEQSKDPFIWKITKTPIPLKKFKSSKQKTIAAYPWKKTETPLPILKPKIFYPLKKTRAQFPWEITKKPFSWEKTVAPFSLDKTRSPFPWEITKKPFPWEKTRDPFPWEKSMAPFPSEKTRAPFPWEITKKPFPWEKTGDHFPWEKTMAPFSSEKTIAPFSWKITKKPFPWDPFPWEITIPPFSWEITRYPYIVDITPKYDYYKIETSQKIMIFIGVSFFLFIFYCCKYTLWKRKENRRPDMSEPLLHALPSSFPRENANTPQVNSNRNQFRTPSLSGIRTDVSGSRSDRTAHPNSETQRINIRRIILLHTANNPRNVMTPSDRPPDYSTVVSNDMSQGGRFPEIHLTNMLEVPPPPYDEEKALHI